LGSNVPIAVDIRLIAATARNLEQAVEEGEFREDLYYRLNVVTIQLPSLRERRQDIPARVQHFLKRGERGASITPEALARLTEYHWPGNVRELENTIERALVLSREGIVTDTEVQIRPPSERTGARWTDQVPLNVGWQASISELEKSLVERALRQTEGNKSKAAELLGIHRRLLYEKMREYGIE
jgi:DNA-binding NtrC family response regulator